MKKKTIWLMAILIALCAVWISCENSMPEKYLVKGGDMAYYIDDSLGYGFDGPTNDEDTSSFWFQTKETLWGDALKSECQEVGGYLFTNSRTGEMRMGSITYGAPYMGSLTPGSSNPRDNGLSNEWVASAYVHTHYSSDCVGEGNMRGVGPSDADQDWANKHGMPVYTIDYQGSYYEALDDYYISYMANKYGSAIWYTTNPKE